LVLLLEISACSINGTPSETPTPEITPTHTVSPTPEPTPTPTNTPIPSTTLTATVWVQDPIIPALTYHQFKLDGSGGVSTNLKMFLSDFREQMEILYQNGFCLVELGDWLSGEMVVAEGCRPLILTMDDLYFNNQLRLKESGNPSRQTGVGQLWGVYRDYPDFGFSIALFANFGNKLYANPDDPGWEEELARTVVWGIEHGAMPYNHFWTHPQLDRTDTAGVKSEATRNDTYLRYLLAKVGREDLIPEIANIIALTYGTWPKTWEGRDAIVNYKNPEGLPVLGVMEIDYVIRAQFILPVYHPNFNRHHIPRIVADRAAIDTLMADVDRFPKAQSCVFEAVPLAQVEDEAYLMERIGQAVANGSCPEGVYAFPGMLFRAENTNVALINID
jgi:hypothetical protein